MQLNAAKPNQSAGNLRIPSPGIGTWSFGGTDWPGQTDRASIGALRKAVDLGIRHIDSALAYGGGKAHRLIANAIEGKRDSLFIATKILPSDGSRDAISRQIDQCLRDLRTDRLDLVYLHWLRPDRDPRPIIENLGAERNSGRIGAVGVSNFNVDQLEAAAKSGRIDAVQFPFSLLWPFPLEDIIPWCRKNSTAAVGYSPLALGALTGKHGGNPEFPRGDVRRKTVFFQPEVWAQLRRRIDEMKQIAERAQCSLTAVALQWVSEQGVIPVFGARNRKQAERNLQDFSADTGKDVFEKIRQLRNSLSVDYPQIETIFLPH